MANVVVRDGEAGSKRIVDMFSPPAVLQIVGEMTEAIAQSFEEFPMRNPTLEEKRRRFNILMRHTAELRGDRKWGVQRICDSFVDILRAELNGGKWEPDDKRTCWIPSDGN